MDTLGEAFSGATNAIGQGASAVGNAISGIPDALGGALGGGGQNPGAGAVNGTPGAVAPAVMSPAGTGASGAPVGGGAMAAASGGLPVDLSSIGGTSGGGPAFAKELGLASSPTTLDQGLASASAPTATAPVSTPDVVAPTSFTPAGSTPPVTTGQTTLPAPTAGAGKPPLWQQAAGVALPFALNALAPAPGAATLKQMKALQSQEAGLANANEAAAQAEQQGLIPQPAQAKIDRQLQETIAQIKNQYAQAGMSGSSAENADIAAAKENAVAEAFTVGNQMAQTALGQVSSESGASKDLLNSIYNNEVNQSQSLAQLIAKMAGLIGTGAVPATKAT